MINLKKNYSYKKQIWNLLWDYKCSSIINLQKHEESASYFKLIMYIIEIFVALLTFIIAILSGINSQYNLSYISFIITIIAGLSICIQATENIISLKEKIIMHTISSSNFKFLNRELQKFMTMQRTTHDFKIISKIFGDIIIVFEQFSPEIPKHIDKKYSDNKSIPPNLPESPELDMDYISLNTNESNSGDSNKFDKNIFIISKYHYILKLFFNDDNIGYYRNDAEGNCIYISSNTEIFIGLPKSNVVYPDGYGWLSNAHEDDGERIYESLEIALKNKNIFIEKARFINKNNITYVFMEAYPIYTSQGIYIGIEGIMIKIEKKIWEKLYINNINMITKNNDGSYNYSNINELEFD
jgi:PAS domain-containing protein